MSTTVLLEIDTGGSIFKDRIPHVCLDQISYHLIINKRSNNKKLTIV